MPWMRLKNLCPQKKHDVVDNIPKYNIWLLPKRRSHRASIAKYTENLAHAFFNVDTPWAWSSFQLSKTAENPIKSRKVEPQFLHASYAGTVVFSFFFVYFVLRTAYTSIRFSKKSNSIFSFSIILFYVRLLAQGGHHVDFAHLFNNAVFLASNTGEKKEKEITLASTAYGFIFFRK